MTGTGLAAGTGAEMETGAEAGGEEGWEKRLQQRQQQQQQQQQQRKEERRGASAMAVELVTWRDPGKSVKVMGGGLYAALCASSLRTMPLPLGAIACYGGDAHFLTPLFSPPTTTDIALVAL